MCRCPLGAIWPSTESYGNRRALEHPRLVLGGAAAFTVVLTEMVAVGLVSGAVLLLAYGPYSRAVLWAAGRATHSQRNLGVFLAVIVAVPLGLLVV